MEGYLKKWINPFLMWKDRYFVLHENCLIYADTQGGVKKGTIHLKIADIMQIPDDPLTIIINSGTKQIEVRAASVELKVKWYNALKESQIKAQSEFEELSIDQLKDMARQSKTLDPKYKRMLLDSNQERIEKLLIEAYETGAKFDETISELLPKVCSNPSLVTLIDRLQNEAHLIKTNLKDCLLGLENERKRLFRAAQVLASDVENSQVETRFVQAAPFSKDVEQNKFFDIADDDDDTEFASIAEDGYFYREQQSFALLEDFNQPNGKNGLILGNGNGLSNAVNNEETQTSLVSYFSKSCPVRYRLLTQNPSYLASEVSNEDYRLTLPKEKDPNEKINIWSIVKDSIGKDLAKFAVPVYLNEPLSMLQRLAEQMEYSETLDSANETDDDGLALCYVMGFGVSVYAGTINRTKKPFNPLLGETFEFVDEKKGYRFVSEQVSHHPPISAGIAESKNYLFWGDSNIKSQFWGKSFEVKPLGNMHVRLRRLTHDIVFKKCTTAAKNIIIGQIYLDHFGTMEYKNHTTGVHGVLNLKEKGMLSDKGQYEISGWVKNKEGKLLYTLFGHWNAGLTATNVATNEVTQIWKRYALPEKSDNYYFYTKYSFQLNHLYKDLMKKIAPTDSRLRPDQRALEYGLLDIASDEKLRLEQKQRAVRKENEASGNHHKIVFFEEKLDSITGEKEYQYKGGYWEAREKGDWSGLGLLDIY